MKTITFIFISALLIGVSCDTKNAEVSTIEQWSSIESYRKAKSILDSAIVALGGLDSIRSIDQITVEYDGLRQMINQSRKPEGPWDAEPSTGKVHIDRKNNRIYTENASYYPGIGSYTGSVRLVGTKGFGIDYQKNYHGTEAWEISGQSSADYQWSACTRWAPPLLALQALDNKISLRFLGQKTIRGKMYSAISFVQPNKSYLVLLFENDTNHLAGYESIRDDGVYGDVTDVVIFSDFRDLDGIKMPAQRSEYSNGELTRELSFKVHINKPMDNAVFQLPDGHTMPVASNEPYVRINKIADGVYMDQDMGGILIVEFNDFCIVLDCPENFSASQSTMDAMREILPSKPIKYVATSHTRGSWRRGSCLLSCWCYSYYNIR
jgi:hypothetical protein